jgi:long-subunit fatty acid transport protein
MRRLVPNVRLRWSAAERRIRRHGGYSGWIGQLGWRRFRNGRQLESSASARLHAAAARRDDRRILVRPERWANWSDSSTIKLGAEYRFDRWALRAGYAWDQQFVNRSYPNTFSSPPSDAHYLTVGGGYDHDSWQLNVAWSQRLTQSAYIEEQQIASKGECPFCGSSGNYVSKLSAAFVDFSIEFEEAVAAKPEQRRGALR